VRRGKRFREAKATVEDRRYELREALGLMQETSFAKFDETVDLAIRLGVDPRRADQMVRGSVLLPHGRGRVVRVLAFAKGEKEKEALEAGADYVGAEDLVERISAGWLEFDRAVATPDVMGLVGRIGKILGPRGLMPNPKSGTVSFEIGKVVSEVKAGKVEFRVDKNGNIHIPIGKVSFPVDSLMENAVAVFDTVIRAKPSSSKGQYIRGASVVSTMGPGVKVDPQHVVNLFK
jgi:large subunit ribosomal protein L1